MNRRQKIRQLKKENERLSNPFPWWKQPKIADYYQYSETYRPRKYCARREVPIWVFRDKQYEAERIEKGWVAEMLLANIKDHIEYEVHEDIEHGCVHIVGNLVVWEKEDKDGKLSNDRRSEDRADRRTAETD